MFRILDGRESFYQWDTDQQLIVDSDIVEEVHFTNKIDKNIYKCIVYTSGMLRVVDVPNILLQDYANITAYAYDCDSDCTKKSNVFKVIKRDKPTDYIYTETEVKRYDDLESRIEYLEKNGTGTGGVGIESVIQTDKDGDYNIVNFTDGNKLKVKNGETGREGKQGEAVRITSIVETQEGNTVNFSDGNTMFVANGNGSESVYQEINSITLNGGESAVDITEDSDKSSFALKAAYVKVEMPASSDSGTGYIETYYEEQRISKHHISNIKQSASAPKTAKAEVIQRYGRWVEHTYGSAAEGATANMLNIVQFVLEATTEELKHIDKIKVRVTGNNTFDAGTKITVWGVRV